MQEDLPWREKKNLNNNQPANQSKKTPKNYKKKKRQTQKTPLFNCHSLLWAEARVLGKVLAEYVKVMKYELVK